MGVRMAGVVDGHIGTKLKRLGAIASVSGKGRAGGYYLTDAGRRIAESVPSENTTDNPTV